MSTKNNVINIQIIKQILKIFMFLLFVFYICASLIYKPSANEECMESGVCEEGLSIKDDKTGNLFIVDKENCYKYNGRWGKNKYRKNKNFCYFN